VPTCTSRCYGCLLALGFNPQRMDYGMAKEVQIAKFGYLRSTPGFFPAPAPQSTSRTAEPLQPTGNSAAQRQMAESQSQRSLVVDSR